MLTSFEELDCWKRCRELRLFIANEVIRNLPGNEQHRIADQMLRAARSATANIAEGYGRFHHLDNAKFCSNARGSCWEVNRCEYCRFPECYAEIPFQIDHIVARQHGGSSCADNLALACGFCNRFKGPNLSGVDPVSRAVVRLFNPRQECRAVRRTRTPVSERRPELLASICELRTRPRPSNRLRQAERLNGPIAPKAPCGNPDIQYS